MKGKSQSGRMILQTALAILLGVLTGMGIMFLTHKRPAAEALTKQAGLLTTQAAQTSFAPIQILPMLSERMNVLVMGVDSNGRNTERINGCRSDTMIVVCMDPIERKVGVVSIPRDSRVTIPNHGTDKINSAHATGGAPLAVQTITENFGVPIDHWIVVDTQGLKGLCQLLGPVDVLVEKDMHYHDWAAHLHIDLKPGLQTLSPEQVEQYVRFRHDAKGDIGRIERQQWFFRQAANKLKDPQFLMRLPDLIKLAYDNIQTDLSLEDMARIATFARDIKVENVVTAMLPGEPQMISGISYWVPYVDESKIVFNRILGIRSGGEFVDGDPNILVDGPTKLASQSVKPLTIALKYPKGCDASANELERLLTNSGYRVRYKWLAPVADCQHEQIVQLSARADDYATENLRKNVPDVGSFSLLLDLQSRPYADFTIVLSNETSIVTKAESLTKTSYQPIKPE